MATQLVQYMDLRLTIDNNPPPYGQQVPYQVRKKKKKRGKKKKERGWRVSGEALNFGRHTLQSLGPPPLPLCFLPHLVRFVFRAN